MADTNNSINVTPPSNYGMSISVSTSQQDKIELTPNKQQVDVSVSSPVHMPLNATPDLSMYYSEVSEDWAKQAENSAERAAQSATTAKNAADSILNNPEVQEVLNSLDIIEAAPENAQIAKDQATLAKSYSDLANENAILASQKADVATEQANVILGQVVNAETYANNANTSANSAKTYAQNAQTSANNAKTSETNAKASETSAKQSATEALSYKNSASSSATSASTSASNAQASASSASVSATTATNQANIATQQAQIAKEEVAKLSNVYSFKGSVDNVDALPTNPSIGDVYDTLETGMNYAWTGEKWDNLGGVFDVSWGNIKGDITTQSDLQIALDKKQDVLTPNAPIELSKVTLSNSHGYTYNDDGSMYADKAAVWSCSTTTATVTIPYYNYIDFPLDLDNANNKFVMFPNLMTQTGAISKSNQALGKLDSDGNFYPIIFINPPYDNSNANGTRRWIASSLATNSVPIAQYTKVGSSVAVGTEGYLMTGDSDNPYLVAYGFQKTSSSSIAISVSTEFYTLTLNVNSSLVSEINCFRVLNKASGVGNLIKPQFIGLYQGSSTVATNASTLRQDVKKALNGELTNEVDIASYTTINQVKLNHDDTLQVVDGKLGANLDGYAKTNDIPDVSNLATKDEIPTDYATKTELNTKQDKLTAGENITIEDNVISATVPESGGGSGMPIGTVYSLSCSPSYVPEGSLPCDGAEYNKAQFSDLWVNYLGGASKILAYSYGGYYVTSEVPQVGDQLYTYQDGLVEIANKSIVEVGDDYIYIGVDSSDGEPTAPIAAYRKPENDIKENGELLDTCAYSEYESDITTYGQCGKFAVDTTNETFRVPFIKDGAVIQQAQSDGELGKSYNAGLPNITGQFGGAELQFTPASGAFYQIGTEKGAGQDGTDFGVGFDASLSNPIYQDDCGTVQPNAVALRYFVVVANGSINESQMDWSNWASSLQGKLNADHSNDTKPYIVETYHNGTSWYRIYSDGWCEQGGVATGASGNTGNAVTFMKTYANTNYTLQASGLTRQSDTFANTVVLWVKVRNLTTTGFSACTGYSSTGSAFVFSWEAKGYIS